MEDELDDALSRLSKKYPLLFILQAVSLLWGLLCGGKGDGGG